MSRTYLDWNATAPLRPEAREAMLAAMDVVGNPSSVHGEGRAAKAIVEKARRQVAALVGCELGEVVFMSGATEANTQALQNTGAVLVSSGEHDSVIKAVAAGAADEIALRLLPCGLIDHANDDLSRRPDPEAVPRTTIGLAVGGGCGETGILQDIGALFAAAADLGQIPHCDVTQRVGRAAFSFATSHAVTASMSAHKLGGPKGTGALIIRQGREVDPLLAGGGQEMGRRSGTENVIGIAGFGAAAEAAQRDLENGVWGRIADLRDRLEERLLAQTPDLIIFGKDAPRLPNTSCFAIPGWKGETQVMQMDLAGFAVSAGSACSSGKVNKASRVLLAMGFDAGTAASAIRVSMGPTTTEAEVMAFADTWIEHYRRRNARAA